MSIFAALVIAMILDAIFGEPKMIWDKVPHPAVLMGRVISAGDTALNSGSSRRIKGAALILGLVIAGYIIGKALHWLPDFGILEIGLTAILIAHRSLVDHVTAVAQALTLGIGDGRQAVAMIVGRDTAHMTESDVVRATIESAAENFSDGVAAPIFWFVIAGLPGILIYKFVNTADSMIGYMTPKYQEFGWAAARLDDLMNWIPARLTGALFCTISGDKSCWRTMSEDAQYHRSPNAGWPEAAMAAALGIALSGPRIYNGARTDDAYVNRAGRLDLQRSDIDDTVAVLWKAWAALAGVALVLALFSFIL